MNPKRSRDREAGGVRRDRGGSLPFRNVEPSVLSIYTNLFDLRGHVVLHQLVTNLHIKSGILNKTSGSCPFCSYPTFSQLLPLFHPCTAHCHIVLEAFPRYQVLSFLCVFIKILLSVRITLLHPTHSQPYYFPGSFLSVKSQVKCHFLGPSQLKYYPCFILSTSCSIHS